MDQQLEQPALDEFARPVLPRPAAVVRQFRRTKIKIYDVVDGIGRSGMLPRQTNEHKLHVADTVNFNPGRMNWKFGGDFLQAWIYTTILQALAVRSTSTMWRATPVLHAAEVWRRADSVALLRPWCAALHAQDFGTSVSHPDSRSYALFVQNNIRVARSFAVNLGLRYDLQTFEVPNLLSNPLYAPSGKVPTDTSNFSPRVGFTYAMGERHAIVMRGGFGRFYSLSPAIYASQVATDNGLAQSHLYLDFMKPADAAMFSHLSQRVGELSFGSDDLHAARVRCQPPHDADFRLLAQLSDAVHRAGEPHAGTRTHPETDPLCQLSLRSRRASYPLARCQPAQTEVR